MKYMDIYTYNKFLFIFSFFLHHTKTIKLIFIINKNS